MSEIKISGYMPGLVGWTVELHGRYYSDATSFGPVYEAKVTCEMGEHLAVKFGMRTKTLKRLVP